MGEGNDGGDHAVIMMECGALNQLLWYILYYIHTKSLRLILEYQIFARKLRQSRSIYTIHTLIVYVMILVLQLYIHTRRLRRSHKTQVNGGNSLNEST